jgi:hypothetical protein
MGVFISWSGKNSISYKVAMLLRDWFPKVIQTVKPFLSAVDIDAGSQWTSQMFQALKETQVGIICVTRTNQAEPWINFEAGSVIGGCWSFSFWKGTGSASGRVSEISSEPYDYVTANLFTLAKSKNSTLKAAGNFSSSYVARVFGAENKWSLFSTTPNTIMRSSGLNRRAQSAAVPLRAGIYHR